jgi:hypothetical protein
VDHEHCQLPPRAACWQHPSVCNFCKGTNRFPGSYIPYVYRQPHKGIFLVVHLPKHHSRMSKVGAFHDAFIQDVVRQNPMPGISQADAKVSSRSGKGLPPKVYSVPAFVKHKLRSWRNNIHRTIIRKYKFQCRFNNKNTSDGLTAGFYSSNRRSRADYVYYFRSYRSDATKTKDPTSSEKVSCRRVPDQITVQIY